MTVRTVKAVYRRGRLVFRRPAQAPREGSTVVVTYAHDETDGASPALKALAALRGRGRGERLGKRLLAERKADRGSLWR
jgi:hypothetical protein